MLGPGPGSLVLVGSQVSRADLIVGGACDSTSSFAAPVTLCGGLDPLWQKGSEWPSLSEGKGILGLVWIIAVLPLGLVTSVTWWL